MDILIRYGFSIEEINIIMDTNMEISNVSDDSIVKLIDILEKIGCSKSNVRNILITNPFYLSRKPMDIDSLIRKMKDFGFNYLIDTLESNPFILNYDVVDFVNLVEVKKSHGLSDSEIRDFISYELI